MNCSRFISVLILALFLSLPVMADPAKEAEAVFDQFLSSFTNSDSESVLSLFADDALFWGTGSKILVNRHEGIQSYFSWMKEGSSGAFTASSLARSAIVLSDDTVIISGMWQIAASGSDTGTPLRVSLTLKKRDGRWQIVQFHNSPVPD